MKYKTVAETFEIDTKAKDMSDCWIVEGNAPVVNPYTSEVLLDYEKLKLKLTTEKFSIELALKRGEYITKCMIESYMYYYAQQLHIFMSHLNNRCLPILKAIIESETTSEILPMQIADLHTTLRNTHKKMCCKMQNNLETYN